MTNSLRARTLINLSAVLYKQSAAQPSLPAKIGNIDLNFMPSIAFIPNVYIANSLRARTLINLSVVLYEQFCTSRQLLKLASLLSLRARTLINLSAVLYKQERTASLAKRIKTDENCKKSTHRQGFNSSSSLKLQKIIRDNIEELICVSKVKHTYTDIRRKQASEGPLGSPFLELIIISKSDKVSTRELSSYIKTELLRDNSCKFYCLVITSEDTHYKQTIKKAYIMLPERASLILFMT
ncbi:hypothetical protein HBH63_234950 [Parastagonospora nodorum]|nr:hypothetical protein HBH63_234950 [Parastagonospora nodorum]KAH4769064.1 hypothetical protein HBH62_233320 [Parastagonospora nodorum]